MGVLENNMIIMGKEAQNVSRSRDQSKSLSYTLSYKDKVWQINKIQKKKTYKYYMLSISYLS